MRIPVGWYPDPWNPPHLRWWDGGAWTEHSTAPPPKPLKPPPPTFPSAAARWLVAGVLTSLIAGHALASFVFDHVSSSVTLYVAVFNIPIFGGLFATCTEISRRFGSGRVRDDFGLSFAWGDTSLGLAIFVVSAICATLVQLPWLNNSSVDRTSDAVHTGIVSWPPLAIAELTVAAVIVAPLLEELAFRGVLERSLTPSMRLPWAIVLQALFFGAYHFTPGLGQYNLPRMLSAAAFGLVAGAAAARYRRLGPGVVAHALANVFVVIAVVTSHA